MPHFSRLTSTFTSTGAHIYSVGYSVYVSLKKKNSPIVIAEANLCQGSQHCPHFTLYFHI
uniref:Uncharacterized protein n=1 Tax=Anguilla anguilla TaxID=7936 RepID=A0A0E9QK43_ANGAN